MDALWWRQTIGAMDKVSPTLPSLILPKCVLAFGRRSDSRLAMLWAYFDESGEHDHVTGHLKQLTIGGWIGPRERWKQFDSEWAAALDRAKIKTMFHMVNFENRTGEFAIEKGWDDDKRKMVLNELLEIIARNINSGIGFTNRVFKLRPKDHFPDTYENNLIDCLMHIANESAYSYAEKISVVFAKHKDYRQPRVQKLFDFMNYGDARLGTLAVSDPIEVRPLQAADIIAYEIKQLQRNDGLNRRYPLRRLEELGCHFRFSGATSFPLVPRVSVLPSL